MKINVNINNILYVLWLIHSFYGFYRGYNNITRKDMIKYYQKDITYILSNHDRFIHGLTMAIIYFGPPGIFYLLNNIKRLYVYIIGDNQLFYKISKW